MKTNPEIKAAFNSIAERAIEYNNNEDKKRKYYRRIVRIFVKDLSEEEQLYVFNELIEAVHYRNIITNPDNVIALHNIKLRSYTIVGIIVALLMVLASMIFKTNSDINHIVDIVSNIMKVISL